MSDDLPRRESMQSLRRAIDILDAVAAGPIGLDELYKKVGLSRSTAARLASTLVRRGYLRPGPVSGYMLGSGLARLGQEAFERTSLAEIATPVMTRLSRQTSEAVNLGVRNGRHVIYVQQVLGQRRLTVRHRVGQTNDLCETALGRALLLGLPESEWLYALGGDRTRLSQWREEMLQVGRTGYALHVEPYGDRIHCVAAPIYDGGGRVLAAISVSTVAQYMPEGRAAELGELVREACRELSAELGWRPPASPEPAAR